jgi:hypothetical protein
LHQYLILDALIKKRNKIATKEMQWSQNVVRMLERHALGRDLDEERLEFSQHNIIRKENNPKVIFSGKIQEIVILCMANSI